MMPEDEIEEIDIDDVPIPGQESTEESVESIDLEDLLDDEAPEPENNLDSMVEQQVVEDAIPEEMETIPEEMETIPEEMDTMSSTDRDANQRIRNASTQLENMVQSVVQDDTNSLAATEIDIIEAKKFLSMHKLSRAKKSVHKAELALVTLEEDVLYLRRSIAMLHRLLKEKKVEQGEVENILIRLRNATSAAEIGDVSQAANEVEYLVDDLIGGNTSTLNPFFFRHFWLGVDTRWPAGGDTGVLLVRLINDGPIAMPAMRLSPPVPQGWYSEPSSVDLPIIAPGGNLPLRFDIKSAERFGADEIPLSRKLAVSTGYEMRSGEIMVTIRAQNRSMEPLSDIVLTPWLPPGYTTAKVPFVERLSPDEVAVIRMQLTIDMGRGGRS